MTTAAEATSQTRSLTVARLACDTTSLDAVSEALDAQPRHMLHAHWDTFPCEPRVDFSIGWTAEDVCVKFRVQEKSLRAAFTQPNDMVCQDSCVEFFFAPVEGVYINVELNCIGAVLAQRGAARHGRTWLTAEQIARIRRRSTLGEQPIEARSEPTAWQLVAAIPRDLLELPVGDLAGYGAAANFYKCGDLTPDPHYLLWNPIDTPAPDFHVSAGFGDIVFA